MLDIKKIREELPTVKAALLKRMRPEDLNLEELVALDDQRRELTTAFEEMQARRNRLSKTKPTPEIIAELRSFGDEIKEKKEELEKVEAELQEKLAALPNIPADDVVAGGKENNEAIYTFGKKPKFNFEPKDHVELATALDIIDYKRAAKMSGANFWVYRGAGAQLEWALLNYFVDFHTKNNYTFISVR